MSLKIQRPLYFVSNILAKLTHKFYQMTIKDTIMYQLNIIHLSKYQSQISKITKLQIHERNNKHSEILNKVNVHIYAHVIHFEKNNM